MQQQNTYIYRSVVDFKWKFTYKLYLVGIQLVVKHLLRCILLLPYTFKQKRLIVQQMIFFCKLKKKSFFNQLIDFFHQILSSDSFHCVNVKDAIDLTQGHYIVSVGRDTMPASQKGGIEAVAVSIMQKCFFLLLEYMDVVFIKSQIFFFSL